MPEAKYPVLFNRSVVRVKSYRLAFLLVIKDDLDLTFLARKPVLEFLRYSEQAFV